MQYEKRSTKRFPFSSPIRYQLKGSQIYKDTVGKDVSDKGIGFIAGEFIPKLAQLTLEFNSPSINKFVKVEGEVRWISRIPYSESFLVGAKFTSTPSII